MFTVEGINDLKTLSDVIDGELFSNNEPFTGITVDSREEVNGTVYLALKGESFDGDIFCQDAIANGSIAVITDISNSCIDAIIHFGRDSSCTAI